MTGNRFLDALSPQTVEALLTGAELVDLAAGASLLGHGERPTHVYFLTRGLASTLMPSEDGDSIETESQGIEGLVGIFSLLGPQISMGACRMIVPGTGLRVRLDVVERVFAESAEFRDAILRLVQVYQRVASQLTGCSRFHETAQRSARWLLSVSDRSGVNPIHLRQADLANVLGAQRTTVALVQGNLQRQKLIDYSRGVIHITNEDGLRGVACECYAVCREAFESFSVAGADKN